MMDTYLCIIDGILYEINFNKEHTEENSERYCQTEDLESLETSLKQICNNELI